MNSTKVDILKLLTIANYAKLHGVSPPRIYQLIKSKELKPIIIDGIKFINKNETWQRN